jgi:diketogulonate reductase-like aldo/keto reductase
MAFQHIFFGVLFTISVLHRTAEMKPVKAQPTVRLMNAAHGEVLMPVVGLGTSGYGGPGDQGGEYWGAEQGHNATLAWLKAGGLRIDTSHSNGSVLGVGTGWVASGVPRSEIFLTSKIEINNYDDVLQQNTAILKTLQTNYTDLLLIHWPGVFLRPGQESPSCKQNQKTWTECRIQSWRALETIFQQGQVNYFFVSFIHQTS